MKKITPRETRGEEIVKDQIGDTPKALDLKKQAERLKRFSEIAMKIDAGKTRDEILNIVRLESKQIFPYEVCLIGIMSQSRTHYVINTLSPVADATELNHKIFPLDEGMVGWVIKNHSPILGDIDSGPAYSQSVEGKLGEFGIRTLLIIPLRIGSDIIGSLAFGSTIPGVYGDDDLSVGHVYSIFLASAIKHVNLLEDTQKRMTQIELIYEVAQQIRTYLVLEDLLNVAATAIQKRFNYFDVTIFLVSEQRNELLLEAHSGSFIDFLPHGYRQPMDQGILGWVAKHGIRELVNDVSQDPRYITYSYHNTRSELAVPIKVEDVVVGVLNIEDTKLHAFDDTDAVVLETLCDQLGAAIKNAKLFEEVRQANMKLTELDKMKSEFLGIVSHDFRSPLSSIILAGKSLLRKEAVQNDAHLQEYIKLMVDQATRLNQLAEDTLSITKIESGSLSYYFKIVNIERLIQDAMSLVHSSVKHTLEYKIHPDAIFIKGDQPKLRQVIQNLVSNAVKYSPRGGKVSVLVDDFQPNEILISVMDEGIGIPPEAIDKLFQKFSRIDVGEARDIKGSGLGLWICREIVQAHGGKIWVESNQGSGCVFKFTLKKAQ
ncbi:MAG: ATP-binding protein [Bacteroidota bacterium]